MELLWTNVALNRRNVVPVLDFLIARGHQECNASGAAQVGRPRTVQPPQQTPTCDTEAGTASYMSTAA